jgi:hypothetical protein
MYIGFQKISSKQREVLIGSASRQRLNGRNTHSSKNRAATGARKANDFTIYRPDELDIAKPQDLGLMAARHN